MSFFESAFLGLVQGLTEFLPISSSGHLFLIPKFFGWSSHKLVFDTTIHLGTLFAVMIYFYEDIKKLITDTINEFLVKGIDIRNFSDGGSLGLKILAGSLPAAFLGFIFGDFFERGARNIYFVIFYILFGTILMLFAELKFRSQDEKIIRADIKNITYPKAVLIGFFQSMALFPGVSRSGATISGGVFSGLNRENAARFSFILSIPVILGASIFKIIDSLNGISTIDIYYLLSGFVFSLLSGLLSIKFLLRYLKNNNLYIFIIYRILLLVFLIVFIT